MYVKGSPDEVTRMGRGSGLVSPSWTSPVRSDEGDWFMQSVTLDAFYSRSFPDGSDAPRTTAGLRTPAVQEHCQLGLPAGPTYYMKLPFVQVLFCTGSRDSPTVAFVEGAEEHVLHCASKGL